MAVECIGMGAWLVNNDGPEPMKLKPLYQWLIVLGVWSPFVIAVASSFL